MSLHGRKAVTDALRDRVIGGLHVGRFRGGERLPGVRALAANFGVNERVVLAAIRALADEGLVAIRPRSGAYVVSPHGVDATGLSHLGSWLVDVMVQARSRGLPPSSVADIFRHALATRAVRAACIECNADQLHLLTSELEQHYGYVTTAVPLDALGIGVAQRADVLVTTVFHAAQVRRVAERAGKPWIAVALHPAAIRDVVRALRGGPVHYIATDPRYERKVRQMLAPLADTANLRVSIVGRDALADIPPDAVTVVMTSARSAVEQAFGRGRGPGHPMYMSRQFSDDSARELLNFIVQANLSHRPRAQEAARAVEAHARPSGT